MNRIFIFFWLTCLTTGMNAQSKKASPKKQINTPQTLSTETPKRVPGTEGKDAHAEAKINSPLPTFEFMTTAKVLLTEKNLPYNKPTIFALFNPNCDHCEKAFMAIQEKKEQFKDANIVFVTFAENYKELDSFLVAKHVVSSPNLFVCASRSSFIVNFFMPNYILPQVMVFNKQRKLKKIFYETVNTDSLSLYLMKP